MQKKWKRNLNKRPWLWAIIGYKLEYSSKIEIKPANRKDFEKDRRNNERIWIHVACKTDEKTFDATAMPKMPLWKSVIDVAKEACLPQENRYIIDGVAVFNELTMAVVVYWHRDFFAFLKQFSEKQLSSNSAP